VTISIKKKGGIITSLDKTLQVANFHLSYIEKENHVVTITIKQTIEAHKPTLVKASWCYILEAIGWVVIPFNLKKTHTPFITTYNTSSQFFKYFPNIYLKSFPLASYLKCL
jgi:hypothetical protein